MPKRSSKKPTQDATYSTRALIGDLFFFLSPYRGQLILASLLRLSSDVVELYPPIALAALVTFIGAWHPGATITPAYWWIGSWYAASLVRQLFMYAGPEPHRKIRIYELIAGQTRLSFPDSSRPRQERRGPALH